MLRDKGTLRLVRGKDWSKYNASAGSKAVSWVGIFFGLAGAAILVVGIYRVVKSRSKRKVAYAKLDNFEGSVASFSALSHAEQEAFGDEDSEEEDLVFHS